MRKILFIFLVLLTGCHLKMDNTPTKKVESYFNKYQMLDKDVLDDLSDALDSENLSKKEKKEYYDFMKKHYRNLTYEIKDETVDGDNAIVTVSINVRNYANALKNTKESKYSAFRLKEMKKVRETKTYTIYVSLEKKNGEWIIDQLSDDDLNKINGLYIK